MDCIRQWVDQQVSSMCGNAICHDRRFSATYVPEREPCFQYPHIAVNTITELAHRRAPDLAYCSKECRHLA